MNVLLSSVGRRNYLVRYFKEAVKGRGEVLAVDCDPTAPGLKAADRSLVVPPISDPSFIDTILNICKAYAVDLLIPLNDLELLTYARSRALFVRIGTIPVVSSPEVITRCLDKWQTFLFLREHGFPTPDTYLSLEDALGALASGGLRCPVIIKPRWGSGSIGIEIAKNREELERLYPVVLQKIKRSILASLSLDQWSRCILIQERVEGQEFGLDIINDLEGRYVATLARRKIAMRAGETDKAVTVQSDKLRELGEKVGNTMGHIGVLDCDVISDGSEFKVLEFNPRFGGGYPFSHEAGANIPAALVAWAEGRQPSPVWLQSLANVTCAKFEMVQVISRS